MGYKDLLQETDHRVWADTFVKSNITDKETIATWFASALMVGADHQYWALEPEMSAFREFIRKLASDKSNPNQKEAEQILTIFSEGL